MHRLSAPPFLAALTASAALVACGSTPAVEIPAPIVTSMTPTSGNWQTRVTIDGANFGNTPSTSSVQFTSAIGAEGFLVDTWSNTEITGFIQFPASGDMTIETDGGTTAIGTFTTSEPWAPSAPLDVTVPQSAIVLETGTVAGLFGDFELTASTSLAVFGGPDAGAYPLSGPYPEAVVIEDASHEPEVIATDTTGAVQQITVSTAGASQASTGITGAVVAAGRDTTGVFAWIDTGGDIERARPGSGSSAPWAVDRGPITEPSPAIGGAVTADGTLWLAFSEAQSNGSAFLSVAQLGSAATTLSAAEHTTSTPNDNELAAAQLDLAADGIGVLATASDTSGTPTAPRVRTAANTWTDPPAISGVVQYAFFGSTLGAIANDATEMSTALVPDVSMPTQTMAIPVWPAQSEALVVDGNNAPHPIVIASQVSYALAPPTN